MHSSSLTVRVALMFALSAPLLAHADWDGGIEGGTVVRDGASATRLRLSLVQNERPLTQAFHADWIDYAEGAGYRLGYVPRFWIDEKLYLFGEGEFRVDKPLGIEQGYLAAGGVGYQLINTSSRRLGVEVGAGVRGTSFENPDVSSDDEDDSEAIALARVSLVEALLDQLRVDADASLVEGETVGEQTADLGLTYRVGNGGVRAGYRVRRLTYGDRSAITDDSTSLTFSYGF